MFGQFLDALELAAQILGHYPQVDTVDLRGNPADSRASSSASSSSRAGSAAFPEAVTGGSRGIFIRLCTLWRPGRLCSPGPIRRNALASKLISKHMSGKRADITHDPFLRGRQFLVPSIFVPLGETLDEP